MVRLHGSIHAEKLSEQGADEGTCALQAWSFVADPQWLTDPGGLICLWRYSDAPYVVCGAVGQMGCADVVRRSPPKLEEQTCHG